MLVGIDRLRKHSQVHEREERHLETDEGICKGTEEASAGPLQGQGNYSPWIASDSISISKRSVRSARSVSAIRRGSGTLRLTRFDPPDSDKDGDRETLPEREEDETLDAEELLKVGGQRGDSSRRRWLTFGIGLYGFRSSCVATQNMARQ